MKIIFFILYIIVPLLNIIVTTSIGVFMHGKPLWPAFSDQLAIMGIYYFLISILLFFFSNKIMTKAVNTKH